MRITAALLLAALALPALAQDNDCFTALAKDANREGSLIAATPSGPVELHRDRYEWQAMVVAEDGLYAFGAGGSAGYTRLFRYSTETGAETGSWTLYAFEDSTIEEAILLPNGRIIGRGWESSPPWRSFAFRLDTSDPERTLRAEFVERQVIGLAVAGPRILAFVTAASRDDLPTALVYDRRTRATSTEAIPVPYLSGAHREDGSGRVWLRMNGSRGNRLALVLNPAAAPSEWVTEDRSAEIPASMGPVRSLSSRNGVTLAYAAFGLVTFRDGVPIGSLALPSGAGSTFPAAMVTPDGGAVIFGGPSESGGGWLEARSPDLAALYGRWTLATEPTWMAAD